MSEITELGLLSAIIRNLSLLEEQIHSTPLTDFDHYIIGELSEARKGFSRIHAKYKEVREKAKEKQVVDLKQAIAKSNLKQYEIAERAGVGYTHLSAVLNGHRELSQDVYKKVIQSC